jgi:WD40 repeat protein
LTPENQVASQRFFQELIVHREKALPPLIASFAHQDTIRRAVFSPDGARILTASRDKTAKLWDAASGKLIASFEHQGIESSMRTAISQKQRFVISTTERLVPSKSSGSARCGSCVAIGLCEKPDSRKA